VTGCGGVDKPGKPGTPEVKEANRSSATLTWKAPSDDGGSAITSYVLEYRADGAFKWKRATDSIIPSTTHVVKGLDEGIKYEFRVAAENRAGVGPASEGSLAAKLEDAMGLRLLLLAPFHHHHHHHHLYSSENSTKAVIENCGLDKSGISTYNCPGNRHKSIKQ